MLLNLNDLWAELGLEERMIDKIVDLCKSSDGNYYIVPIGIHKTNTIFYNCLLYTSCA